MAARLNGGVAQLGEHLPCKQGVKSSNLSVSTRDEKSRSFYNRTFAECFAFLLMNALSRYDSLKKVSCVNKFPKKLLQGIASLVETRMYLENFIQRDFDELNLSRHPRNKPNDCKQSNVL